MVRAASRQRRYRSLACHILVWAWRRTLALSCLTYAASAHRRRSSRRRVMVRCHQAWMWQALRAATASARRTSCPRHQAWMATAAPWLSRSPLASMVLGWGQLLRCSGTQWVAVPGGRRSAGVGFGSPPVPWVQVDGWAQGHAPEWQ